MKLYIEKEVKGNMQEQTKKQGNGLVVFGLMMALLLAALDQTIVSTAMPTILKELGGFEKFVWVFSAYLITSVAGMPIFGKLSDMYGRKKFFLFGLLVFMAGSALCGLAQDMNQLILYRAIQGIGGGALMPVIFTIVYDIFPAEKRGKMQGLFGAVFGLSSVLGPLVGSLFTDYMHWTWIFYINLPLGVVAFFILLLAYHESKEHRRQQIDWIGTILMVGSILSLMFALELGGKDGYAWDSATIIGLFAGFAVLLVLFILSQRAAKDPIVPLGLFKNRLFTACMGTGFFFGAIMIAGATYIPLFIQGVFSGSATNAGLVLMPLMIGSVISSMIGGRCVGKFSFRTILGVAVILVIAATVLLSTISIDTSKNLIRFYMILLGLGIGASFSVIPIAALNNISFHQRGTVTSLNSFFRTVGSAICITVLGTLQSRAFQDKIQSFVDPSNLSRIGDGRGLLQEEVRVHIPQDILHKMLGGLADSIAYVFQWSIVLAVIAAIFILMMGRAKMELPSVPNQTSKDGESHVDEVGDTRPAHGVGQPSV